MCGVGVAWASILSMPYAILAGSLPAGRVGLYMGVFNFFIVLPEILQALTFGPLIRTAFGEGNPNAPVYVVLIGGWLSRRWRRCSSPGCTTRSLSPTCRWSSVASTRRAGSFGFRASAVHQEHQGTKGERTSLVGMVSLRSGAKREAAVSEPDGAAPQSVPATSPGDCSARSPARTTPCRASAARAMRRAGCGPTGMNDAPCVSAK